MRVGRIFFRGANSGVFHRDKKIFSKGGQQWLNCILTVAKLREKHFSTKKSIAKYQVSKPRSAKDPSPVRCLLPMLVS